MSTAHLHPSASTTEAEWYAHGGYRPLHALDCPDRYNYLKGHCICGGLKYPVFPPEEPPRCCCYRDADGRIAAPCPLCGVHTQPCLTCGGTGRVDVQVADTPPDAETALEMASDDAGEPGEDQ